MTDQLLPAVGGVERGKYDPAAGAENYVPAAPPQEAAGLMSTLGAAFEQGNTVPALWHLLTRGTPAPDPNFDFDAAAKKSDVYSLLPDKFMDVQSGAEFTLREQQVREELHNQMLISQAGWTGTVASIIAGVVDPINMLPAGTILKGAKAVDVLKSVMSVGAAAGAATAVQEGILQADQMTRTKEESAVNILGGAVLGGLLGGGFSLLAKKSLGRVAADMVAEPGAVTILPTQHPSSLGAAVNPDAAFYALPDDVSLAPSFGLARAVKGFGPATRQLQSELPMARKLMGSLDTGGLAAEKVMNIGGDVESLAKGWSYLTVKALQERDRLMGGNMLTRAGGIAQFNEDAAKALRRGATGDTPADEWARFIRKEFYTPFYNEMKKVGMVGDLPEEFVANYLTRLPRRTLIQQNFHDLQAILEEHFSEQLKKVWDGRAERVTLLNERDNEAARIIGLSPEDAKKEYDLLKEKIDNLPHEHGPEFAAEVENIRQLREQARSANRETAKKLRADANTLEAGLKDTHPEEFGAFKASEAQLKGKFRLLDRTASSITRENAKLFARIRDTAQLLQRQRGRLVESLNKLGNQLQSLSERERDDLFDKLDDQIASAEQLELAAMKRAGDDLDAIKAAQDKYGALRDKLTAARDDAANLDVEAAAAEIHDAQSQLISDGIAREQGYQEKISKLQDRMRFPEEAAAESKALQRKATERSAALMQRAMGEGVWAGGATPINVTGPAKQLADQVTSKMAGEPHVSPFLSVLTERGPELARLLNIDETRVWANGKKFEDFLENDMDIIMRAYGRTMAPDIELMRKFGTVNPMEPGSPFRQALRDEAVALREKATETLQGTKLEKRLHEIAMMEDSAVRDLKAVVERVRNYRGAPQNPNGIGHRTGRAMMALNTTRMMGKPVTSSIPDVAAIMWRHGPVEFFRDGLVPYIANIRQLGLQRKDLNIAGAALDLTLHGRAAAFGDVFDSSRALSAPERFLQYASSHMGMLSGMNRWNTEVKTLAGHVTMARLSRALEEINAGKLTRSNELYLGRFGINSQLAEEMARQLAATGDHAHGMLLPNLEDWGAAEAKAGDWFGYEKALEAKRAFQAAIVRDSDDTIIVPGGERPLWMDGSTLGRMVAQFRSFTASATTKMMVSGAQQLRAGDMAPMLSIPFLLASGALSYYTWAMTTSDSAAEEMHNASWDKWAWEMTMRAMPLGVLGEMPSIMQDTLGVNPAPMQDSKHNYRHDVFQLLGPSADLAERLTNVASGTADSLLKKAGQREGEPGLSGSERNDLRALLPYNNLWPIARLNHRLFMGDQSQ